MMIDRPLPEMALSRKSMLAAPAMSQRPTRTARVTASPTGSTRNSIAASSGSGSGVAQHVPGRFTLGQRRDRQQARHRLAGFVAAAQLFWVVGYADRVVAECLALEIAVELLWRREIVDLQLDPVVVGVAIVD